MTTRPVTSGSAGTAERPARIVILNNSQETFTPTMSGAIATCIWEMLRTPSPRGARRIVLSRPAAAAPYPYGATHFLDAGDRGLVRGRPERALRRLTGWAHPGQRGYAADALEHLTRLQPDAVICNNDPEIAVALTRRLPHTRVVHWFHNLEVASDARRRALTRDQRIRSVAVSGYLARAIEQVYRMTPLSVSVARNGVDSVRFRPGDPASDVPTVVFLGRVAVEKGTDTFLEAVRILARRGSAFRVLLIGDTNWGFSDGGPYGRRVEDLARDAEAGGVVLRRAGHVVRDALPDLLRSADIQVMSSRWDEPCALTILEGMASGLAMVATATGGTPELVGDAGLLVPRESPDAMADAVESLLRDGPARARRAAAARRRAESFTWARTWAALEDAALAPEA